MTTLEVCSLIVSTVAALIAISVIIQTVISRRQIAKETEERFKFITYLIANTAADPDTVRRIMEDYHKIGEYGDRFSPGADGTYHLHYDTPVEVTTGIPGNTPLSSQQPAMEYTPRVQNRHNGDGRCEDIEHLVGLVRKGDASSLSTVRRELEKTIEEISALVGVPAGTLSSWESGQENPVNSHLITWRLKLGDLVDERISGFIGTDNKQLVTQFWEIMWRFHDLNSDRK